MEQWQGQMFQRGFPFGGPVGVSQGGEQGCGGGTSLGPFPGTMGMMDGVGAHDAGGMLGGVLGSGMLGGSVPVGGVLGGIMSSNPPGGFPGGVPGLPSVRTLGGMVGSLAGVDGLGGVGGMNDMSGMSGVGGTGSIGGKGGLYGMPGLGGLPGVPSCMSPGFVAALGSLPHLGGLRGNGALSGMPGTMNRFGPIQSRDDRDKGVTNDELSNDVRDFVDKWNLEQRFEARLIEQLRKRGSTWHEDLSSLGKTLQEARSPPALLSVKLREMEEGTWEPNRSGGGRGGSAGRFSHGAAGGGAGGGGGGGSRGSGGGSAPEWMAGEIRDFCDKFSLDDRLQHRLTDAMRSRERTFKDDMKSLSEVLATARNPPGLLSVKLREMEDGSFVAKGGGRGGGAVGLDGVAGPRGGISADRKRELFGSLSPPPKKRQHSESRDRRRRGRSKSRRRGSHSRSRRRGKEGREREKEKDHQERRDRRKDSNHEKVREEGPE